MGDFIPSYILFQKTIGMDTDANDDVEEEEIDVDTDTDTDDVSSS